MIPGLMLARARPAPRFERLVAHPRRSQGLPLLDGVGHLDDGVAGRHRAGLRRLPRLVLRSGGDRLRERGRHHPVLLAQSPLGLGQVGPIPHHEGNRHPLNFDGNCREAMEFHKNVSGPSCS